MDFFMPAERVLYDRSYYFSDEAVDDYNEYIADRDGVNVECGVLPRFLYE